MFDGAHETQLREAIGTYVGIVHAGVLSPDGTLRPDVTTLIQLDDPDVARGYAAGRDFFFLQAESEEERTLTDERVIAWLKEIVQEAPLAAWKSHPTN